MKPLALDLCCGLGGFTEGLLAEGWDVIGYDVERHDYGNGSYPGKLVIQDIRTLDGLQFRARAKLVVASPPCTEFSYMAMPWKRGKKIAAALRGTGAFPEGYRGSRTVAELTELFDACGRIGREVGCPTVIENVRGAQPWVGRAQWNFGSFFLWGDVPALMPIAASRQVMKAGIAHRPNGETNFHGHGTKVTTMGAEWYPPDHPKHVAGLAFNTVAHNTTSGKGQNPDGRKLLNLTEATKQGGDWFNVDCPGSISRRSSSKSKARKAASAAIAKIPLVLARWIGATYFPTTH